MSHVRAVEIENWADMLDARQRLPQIVRRLAHATVENLIRIDFPAGEGVQRPGWDGTTETNTVHPFVPQGLAVWELGCDRDPRSKAQGDYEKRVKDPLGLDPSQTTYVCVTPRKWTNKEDWCREKNEEKVWKEVRVYDSANLEEWLETAPAVDLWFARTLGRRPTAIADITEHWENLSVLTDPSLRPEVFLTSRDELRTDLAEWLQGGPSVLALDARSPGEAIDFLSAHLAALPDQERDVFESRIVLVESRDAWSGLAGSRNRLFLVPSPSLALESELVAQAVRQGHHVLISSRQFGATYSNKRTLPRTNRSELEKALTASGLDEEKARRLARDSGGSLTVMKRRLSRFPGTRQPRWSQPPESAALAAILLAGGWNDASQADREAIEKLARRPYADVLAVATRWAGSDDPPLTQIGSSWSLTSREDSWDLLSSSITRQDLDTFESVAVDVLGEDDPRWELPSDERWVAAIHGKVRRYSSELSSGLVETLALLGAKEGSLNIQDSVGPTNRAIRVVRALLPDGASWRRWATTADHLPLIAEAAPEAFFDAVEADLQGSDPQLVELFAQEGDGFYGPSPHPGLLWALEGLAWEPPFLSRSALILSRLAQNDPGGRIGNRPERSLREIFLPWHPHTLATSDQRLRTLDVIMRRCPDVGWKLLLSLLPHVHSISTPTHRPSWRGANLDWSRTFSRAEHWQHVQAVADRLLAHATNRIDRWQDLIESFEHLPKEAQNRVVVGLKAIDPSSLDEGVRKNVASKLRAKVVDHRSFADALWALPEDVLVELDSVLKQFEPDDPIARHSWLFVDFPHLPGETHEQSWENRQAAVFEARKAAVQETLTAGGVVKVLDLGNASEAPAHLGFVLGKAKLLEDLAEIVPKLLDSQDTKLSLLARGVVMGRFAADSWAWAETQPLSEWPPRQTAFFLTNLPFERRTWDLVESLGEEVKSHYWKSIFPFARELSSQDVERAVKCLLDQSRPMRALDAIQHAIWGKCEVESSLIMQALEASLKPRGQGEPTEPTFQTTRYHIQQLFLRLQNDAAVDQQRLASLEWAYLPFLDEHSPARPKALHAWLQRDPGFFADALKVCFYPRSEPKEEPRAPTEEETARAHNAYKLVKSWMTLPGARDDGTIDSTQLQTWVDTARRLCRDADRVEVCDNAIGELLAHSPTETDGSWPCIPVREVLEESESAKTLEGFQTGIYNKRGIVSRSLTEGGEQERQLAVKYDSDAAACEIEWPRVAGALRSIADVYRHEARRWDNDRESMW